MENPITWRKSSYSGARGECVEVGWRKSSYSGIRGECVEVGWHKSTYSGPQGECVEVAEGPETFLRDTQHRSLAQVSVPSTEWTALLGAVTAE